jgi:hypothetical protein
MLKSEKNLRWLGLDMRPCWRRRAAVTATYLALIAVVAEVEDGGYRGHPLLTMIVLAGAILFLGVFSGIGPVKSFEEPPPSTGFRSRYVIVHGLDDLARYRYGVANYDAANEEQKSDLLQTYHVGMRLFPHKPSFDEQYGLDEQEWLDEREKKERVEAERWARRWLTTMIAVSIGRYAGRHTSPQPLEVAGDLLWLFIVAVTLPTARVLWIESDPRETHGEIELVEKNTRT